MICLQRTSVENLGRLTNDSPFYILHFLLNFLVCNSTLNHTEIAFILKSFHVAGNFSVQFSSHCIAFSDIFCHFFHERWGIFGRYCGKMLANPWSKGRENE